MPTKGDFVTARLLFDKNNNPAGEDCRQGIIIAEMPNTKAILIEGQTGTRYICDEDATLVPDSNLFAHTLEWVKKVRERISNNSTEKE